MHAQIQEEQGEQMESPALVAENTTTQKEDVSGVNDGTIAENATVQKEEIPQHQPTALERIPTNEQGEPIYEQADPETAWDAIVEQTEGDESIVQSVADGMVADMEAAVKRAEKAKVKGGTTIAEKIAAEKERVANIEQAKARLEHWKKIASTNSRRQEAIQVEESRKAKEAALLRKEQEEKERDKREEVTERNSRLTEKEALILINLMETNAIDDPQIALTPRSWLQTFGINNSIDIPIGKVKMSENQYAKLQDKNRSEEFGMISLTLSDPDVIFIEPSEANIEKETERPYSYVFAKTFKRGGKKLKFFTSVTVSIDGLEISVSSHIASTNNIKKKLMEFDRKYTKKTLFPNSSEMHLTEHQSDVPDLLPTQGNNVSSAGKVSETSNAVQGNVEKTSENEDLFAKAERIASAEQAKRTRKNEATKDRLEDKNNIENRESGKINLYTHNVDMQGNLLDENGELKLEKVNSIGDITDDDFNNPTRNIELPAIPQRINDAIGANGKRVIIKKNIFEKNKKRHRDLTPTQSRDIIKEALYNATLYGQNQKETRPYNWILIHNKDKNSSILIEVNNSKNNVEVINWHYLNDNSLERKKRQAIREGGRILTLESAVANTSEDLSSAGKVSETSNAMQENAEKSSENEATRVETTPTEAQKEAGNYKKGHIKVDGMNITIEQPKGSIRRGKDASGKEWESEMHNTYGYIRGTEGVDGDHIDIFLSDNPNEGNVFVVDQVNKDGSFDEHKVMYGFADKESARQAYLSNYEDGWQGLGNITEVSKEEFKKWIGSSKRKTKPFAEYKGIQSIDHSQKEQLDTSIKLSHTSFASEEEAEQAIQKYVEIREKRDSTLEKITELIERIREEYKGDPNVENIVKEKTQALRDEFFSLFTELDKFLTSLDKSSNDYVTQVGNDRLVEKGVLPINSSSLFQSRKNEVAQNAVVHLLKRIGIPVHFISRVGAKLSGNGTAKGWTNGLEIWITKDRIDAETPVHEYTHIWTFALMKKNPKLWAEIKNLLKDSEWVDKIQSMDEYKDTLDNEDLLYSEVLSRISGERNGEKFESMAFKLIEEVNSVEKKVDLKRGLEKLCDALKRFWEWGGVNLFGMKEFKSVDDVCDRILFDLLNESDIARTEEMREYYEEEREMNTIIDKAKEDGTYLKAPNGEDSKLPEKEWAYARTKEFKRQLSDRLNLILNESKEDFKDWEKEEFRDLFKAHGLLGENNEPSYLLVSDSVYTNEYFDRLKTMQLEAQETMNSGKGGKSVSSVKSVEI